MVKPLSLLLWNLDPILIKNIHSWFCSVKLLLESTPVLRLLHTRDGHGPGSDPKAGYINWIRVQI